MDRGTYNRNDGRKRKAERQKDRKRKTEGRKGNNEINKLKHS
jgi:hypothetical protein